MMTHKLKQFYLFLLSTLVFSATNLQAQLLLPHYPDSLFSTYYHQRVTLFNLLPDTRDDIIFLGNSITDGGEWSELFSDLKVKNRGISGDNTVGIINRLDEIVKRKPAKVFLMIGVNDLAMNVSPDSIVKNILFIAGYIHQINISTQLYIQSILPVNDAFGKFKTHTNKGIQVKQINDSLKINAHKYHFEFIDLYPSFCDKNGKLNPAFTNDGLHLKGEGYLLWKHLVYPSLYGLQEMPSLIPQPQDLKWSRGIFPLYACKTILVKEKSLQNEAVLLQQKLEAKGLIVKIKNHTDEESNEIELKIEKINSPLNSKEAYHLKVSENKISLIANDAQGIFNAIQTLDQLMRDGSIINTCEITDWPAFSWRGYMVDVGRNFQSIQQLKQQVDVMAAYKLNIFHLHLTEDIAWRIQSKIYPQITRPENMLRNPGEYYSLEEIKDLIAYCKKRHITLVPEIDMPGHSAAFKRAIAVDMQSEEGMRICKNILSELCDELDIPYIHIGGDEVNITNKNFLPSMINFLKSKGKTVIAWDPGGNVPNGTLLQMWNGNTKSKPDFPAIDSRHLYLNHFDPFDGVVTIFNHRIDDTNVGDTNKIGATLCNWPDRRVSEEEDLLTMNAVYPAMITFAERCWQGGGWGNYLSDFDKPATARYQAFVSFEQRLLDHKKEYFVNKPFPYFKQSDIEWKLIGPFENKGITETIFTPESKTYFDTAQLKNNQLVYGATIWLRHFWYPMISGHLKNSKENTTWYATRKIWRDEDGEYNFWIGFNNLSRSTATNSPPEGKWDDKSSAVWVNGKLIDPPHWQHAGLKGDSEIPLTNEGYEYRDPTKIYLNKGWNIILIKAPAASFKNTNWQNPVKWMFTFVEAK